MDIIYDKDRHLFVLSENTDINIEIPFPFIDNFDGRLFDIPDISKYEIKDYYKIDCGENDIYTIYVNKNLASRENGRVGWAIPYISLISTEHDYVQKDYFAEYAFTLYYKVFGDTEFQKILLENNGEFVPSFQSYFCDEGASTRIAFIAEKSNFTCPITFDAFDYSALQYGYSPIKRLQDNCNKKEITSGKLKLKRASTDIYTTNQQYNDDYYKNFIEYIANETNTNIRFYHLYQIIETIINESLVKSLTSLIEKAKAGIVSVRDFDTYIKNNTEFDRINKVFSAAGINNSDYANILNEKCNKYLSSKGHDVVTFPKCIYSFRNQMVHRFRLVIGDEDVVSEINDIFEMLLLELLINYKSKM